MKFKNYLTEKTYDIQQDVDWIYKKYFKGLIEDLLKKNVDVPFDARKNEIKEAKIGNISTGDLKSEVCKVAHAYKPCEILMGILKEGSFYNSLQKLIVISLSFTLVDAIVKVGVRNMSSMGKREVKRMLSPYTIKSTIAHELSHWIDDALHGQVEKYASLAKSLDSQDVMRLGKEEVDLTYFEINASINAIKNAKKNMRLEWDAMTMEDLFREDQSLGSIYSFLLHKHGQKVTDIWQKALVKRMARENLLGKNMKRFVKGEIY